MCYGEPLVQIISLWLENVKHWNLTGEIMAAGKKSGIFNDDTKKLFEMYFMCSGILYIKHLQISYSQTIYHDHIN
jgi:hypothetical protein